MVAKNAVPSKQGLLPTPSMPKGLPKAQLTDNARQVLERRYVRRGDDGKPAESVEEMFWRVAYHVAKAEEDWDGDVIARSTGILSFADYQKILSQLPDVYRGGHAAWTTGRLFCPSDHR